MCIRITMARRRGTRCSRRRHGTASAPSCSAIAASASRRCAKRIMPLLIGMMEAIEEIPGIALAEGLKWNWESFPRISRRAGADAARDRYRRADAAPPVAGLRHGRTRDALEAATGDDIAAMRRRGASGMQAGAFGFTTSRTNSHKTPAGEMVPGRVFRGRGTAGHRPRASRPGYGAFGVNSDFDDEAEELKWMTGSARRPAGRCGSC